MFGNRDLVREVENLKRDIQELTLKYHELWHATHIIRFSNHGTEVHGLPVKDVALAICKLLKIEITHQEQVPATALAKYIEDDKPETQPGEQS